MTLTVSTLAPASGTTVSLQSGTQLHHQGKVIQTIFVRSDSRTTFAAPPTGNGVQVTPLNLTITPRRADSVIWLRWTIFYEMHHDTVFLVQQDSSLIGFNTYRGNVRWSGILTPLYDNDYNSTPQNSTINWFAPAGSTAARTYSLCVRSSSGGSYTLALNRTNGLLGQDSYENGVSYGIAREICG
jgi:hypothetical protein